MRKISITLTLLLGFAISIFAQKADKTSAESRANFDLEKIKAVFGENEEMALTADQETQLSEAYQSKYDCFQEARTTAEKEEIRKQMRACNQTANQAFQEILSEEQLSYYREKQREKRTEALKKMKSKGDREINYLKEVLTGELSLTEEQETAIQAVYEEEQEAFREASVSMKNKQVFQKKRSKIVEDTKEKIKAILTEAQWTAYSEAKNK